MRVKGSFITFSMIQLALEKVNRRDYIRNVYEHLANHLIISIWHLQLT